MSFPGRTAEIAKRRLLASHNGTIVPQSGARLRVVMCAVVLLITLPVAAADVFSTPTDKDVPALIEYLRDPNFQLGASRALVSLKSHSVPLLVTALDSDSPEARIQAAYTLGQIGDDASPAVLKLAVTLTSASDLYERAAAAKSLGQITAADAGGETVRALVAGLSDSEDRVRIHSAIALGQLGSVAQPAVPDLVKALASNVVRDVALKAVVQIGKSAVPELVAALNTDTLRLEAAQALREIDPAAALTAGVDRPTRLDLPALRIALLDDRRSETNRTTAARQLGEVGPEAASILVAAFSSSDEQVARAAVSAFHNVGPAAVPLLIETLTNESADVRAKAADALGAIGPAARPSVPNLVAVLTDEDRTVRHRAVVALDAFESAASDAVPALIDVMQNPRDVEQTRQLALKVLVRAASDAQRKAVIEALETSAKDSNFGISSLASISLSSLTTAVKDAER